MKKAWILILSCSLGLSCTPSVESSEKGSPSNNAKSLNPNGDSELALLMREMTQFMRQSLDSLQREAKVPEMPQTLLYLDRAEATPGMIADRTHFNGFASLWLAQARALETASLPSERKAAYGLLQQSCLSCHRHYCQGPIPMIQGLALP